jgi:hypothetical protein
MESQNLIFWGIGVADWLKFSAVIIAATGLFLNVRQLKKANNQRRAELVSNAVWNLYDDKDLAYIYYKIEYHEFEYGPNFHGSDDEKNWIS